MTFSTAKMTLALTAAVTLSACSGIEPQPFSEQALAEQNRADHLAAQQDVDPITGALTLEQAIARALKYNLDRRARMLEEALAFQQFDASRYDMLPKLLAQAGYSSRNNDKISQSRNAEDGSLSQSRFISQDRDHTVSSLGLSWNMLDLGVGYYGARQQADRALIAGEKRRKAMHLLMQDVRTAFWRAVSAQKLEAEVRAATRMAEDALADARQAEAERLRNPLDSLRYQRQVLENLRLLEAIEQELSTAQTELALLINAPLGQTITLAEPAFQLDQRALEVPVAVMEDTALEANADLREAHYNARIAREETRKTLVRLFPSLTFNYGVNYDTDSYLVNRQWNEAGAQLSFNLFNLLSGPSQLKLAEAGVSLADQRRVSMQMAVLAQVHLARQQLVNAQHQFTRADAIWTIDHSISEHMNNREAIQVQSKLDRVANQTTAILSLLRRYQALAQAQTAEARLQATLGVEPQIGSVGDLSLNELVHTLADERGGWQLLAARAAKDAAQ
ncbi:TolC family protein [Pseudomonas sp.]|uniref:TolC family protein n=1 Tax=Pseudomonas sp. TaxID=306 RepID=UPI003D0BFF29